MIVKNGEEEKKEQELIMRYKIKSIDNKQNKIDSNKENS